jgi:hypothetical protein
MDSDESSAKTDYRKCVMQGMNDVYSMKGGNAREDKLLEEAQ